MSKATMTGLFIYRVSGRFSPVANSREPWRGTEAWLGFPHSITGPSGGAARYQSAEPADGCRRRTDLATIGEAYWRLGPNHEPVVHEPVADLGILGRTDPILGPRW